MCVVVWSIGGGSVKRRKKKGQSVSSGSTHSPQQMAASLLPLLSSLPSQLNLVEDVEPDEEGYFNFMVGLYLFLVKVCVCVCLCVCVCEYVCVHI